MSAESAVAELRRLSADEQLDELFARWNRNDEPGLVVGVAKDGAVIYRRGFGMASLETAVANTTLAAALTAAVLSGSLPAGVRLRRTDLQQQLRRRPRRRPVCCTLASAGDRAREPGAAATASIPLGPSHR